MSTIRQTRATGKGKRPAQGPAFGAQLGTQLATTQQRQLPGPTSTLRKKSSTQRLQPTRARQQVRATGLTTGGQVPRPASDMNSYVILHPSTGKALDTKTAATPREVAVWAAYRDVPTPITVAERGSAKVYIYELDGFEPDKTVTYSNGQRVTFRGKPILRAIDYEGKDVGQGRQPACVLFPSEKYPAGGPQNFPRSREYGKYKLDKGFAAAGGRQRLAKAQAARRASSGRQGGRRKSSGRGRKQSGRTNF